MYVCLGQLDTQKDPEGEAPLICHPFTWFINRSRYSWSLQTTMRRSGIFAGFRQFLSNAFKRILRLLTHFFENKEASVASLYLPPKMGYFTSTTYIVANMITAPTFPATLAPTCRPPW